MTMMQPSGDRRKWTRLGLHWPVRLMRSGNCRAVESETKNVSRDGFYCICCEEFHLGERLECDLRLPALSLGFTGIALLLSCQAKVIRVEAVDHSGAFGIACRIETFSLLSYPQETI